LEGVAESGDLSTWMEGVGVEAAEAEAEMGRRRRLGRRVLFLQGKEANR